MQKTYIAFIGFALTAALTFGIGFKLGQNSEVLKIYTQSNNKQQMGHKSSFSAEKPNQVAAVLLMPKSYLPLLEKFKHRKMAQGTAFLFLLKGAATNKFRYTAGQSMIRKTGL